MRASALASTIRLSSSGSARRVRVMAATIRRSPLNSLLSSGLPLARVKPVMQHPVRALAMRPGSAGDRVGPKVGGEVELLGVEIQDRRLEDGCVISVKSAVREISSSGYVYAVLNAPDYRARYADGLRFLFPRVPITPATQEPLTRSARSPRTRRPSPPRASAEGPRRQRRCPVG